MEILKLRTVSVKMAYFANSLLRSFSLASGRRFYSCSRVSAFSTSLTSTRKSQFRYPWLSRAPVWSRSGTKRHYASSSGKESDGEGDSTTGEEEGEEQGEHSNGEGEGRDPNLEEELGDLEMLPVARHHAIAPVNIPDNFPEVPILPISRNPLFPRFVKMLEVSPWCCLNQHQ